MSKFNLVFLFFFIFQITFSFNLLAEEKVVVEMPVATSTPTATPTDPVVEERADENFTLKEFNDLRAGKVLIKTGFRAPGVPDDIGSQIAAIAYMKAPIGKVWDILSKWQSYEKIFPNVKEVKLIERKDNRILLYFNISLSVKNIEYYLNYYFFKDKNLVTFQLDRNKENDFRRFHGYFKFDPISPEEKELVQVVYSVDVELGKFLPAFIKNYFAKKSLPKVMANLKKWVELKTDKLKKP